MRKIPTLFVRDFDRDPRYVTRAITPGCEWVIKGEGGATRKYDGTCVMFDGERWWARREVKPKKAAPCAFMALETDSETGKMIGWEPAEQSGFWLWLSDALAADAAEEPGRCAPAWTAGTYELVGPRVNGNPENAPEHMLLFHEDAAPLDDAPRDFDGLATWLHAHPYEGIVWHHPDGRMAKIKRRDFPG